MNYRGTRFWHAAIYENSGSNMCLYGRLRITNGYNWLYIAWLLGGLEHEFDLSMMEGNLIHENPGFGFEFGLSFDLWFGLWKFGIWIWQKSFIKPQRTSWSGWWFGTWLLFFPILGMSSSQLTHIFQRGRYTANQWCTCLLNTKKWDLQDQMSWFLLPATWLSTINMKLNRQKCWHTLDGYLNVPSGNWTVCYWNHGPFIDYLPIEVIFNSYIKNYQRVTLTHIFAMSNQPNINPNMGGSRMAMGGTQILQANFETNSLPLNDGIILT